MPVNSIRDKIVSNKISMMANWLLQDRFLNRNFHGLIPSGYNSMDSTWQSRSMPRWTAPLLSAVWAIAPVIPERTVAFAKTADISQFSGWITQVALSD